MLVRVFLDVHHFWKEPALSCPPLGYLASLALVGETDLLMLLELKF